MAKKKAPKKEYSEKTKRHTTQLQGVYERHAIRETIGPDVCYDITYKAEGKKVWEKVGWKSEGYSPELARGVRNDRIKALRHGEEQNRRPGPSPSRPWPKSTSNGRLRPRTAPGSRTRADMRIT